MHDASRNQGSEARMVWKKIFRPEIELDMGPRTEGTESWPMREFLAPR